MSSAPTDLPQVTEKIKGKRGRPRLQRSVQSQTERRRVQVRDAQRTYRLKRESAVQGLQRRVKLCEAVVADVEKLFQDFYESGVEMAVKESNTELMQMFANAGIKFEHAMARLRTQSPDDDDSYKTLVGDSDNSKHRNEKPLVDSEMTSDPPPLKFPTVNATEKPFSELSISDETISPLVDHSGFLSGFPQDLMATDEKPHSPSPDIPKPNKLMNILPVTDDVTLENFLFAKPVFPSKYPKPQHADGQEWQAQYNPVSSSRAKSEAENLWLQRQIDEFQSDATQQLLPAAQGSHNGFGLDYGEENEGRSKKGGLLPHLHRLSTAIPKTCLPDNFVPSPNPYDNILTRSQLQEAAQKAIDKYYKLYPNLGPTTIAERMFRTCLIGLLGYYIRGQFKDLERVFQDDFLDYEHFRISSLIAAILSTESFEKLPWLGTVDDTDYPGYNSPPNIEKLFNAAKNSGVTLDTDRFIKLVSGYCNNIGHMPRVLSSDVQSAIVLSTVF